MARRRRRVRRTSKRSKKVVVTVSVPAGAHAHVRARKGRKGHRRLGGGGTRHRLPGRRADGTFKKGRHSASRKRRKSGSKRRARYKGTIRVVRGIHAAYLHHRSYPRLGSGGKRRGKRQARNADGTFKKKGRKKGGGRRRKTKAWSPFGLLGP
jgi:hypothetical protein